jgi:hypothetical protein
VSNGGRDSDSNKIVIVVIVISSENSVCSRRGSKALVPVVCDHGSIKYHRQTRDKTRSPTEPLTPPSPPPNFAWPRVLDGLRRNETGSNTLLPLRAVVCPPERVLPD